MAKAVSVEKDEKPIHDDYDQRKDAVDSEIEGTMEVKTDKDSSTKTTRECVREFTYDRMMDLLKGREEHDGREEEDDGREEEKDGREEEDDGRDDEVKVEDDDKMTDDVSVTEEDEGREEKSRMNICSFGLNDEDTNTNSSIPWVKP